MPNEAAVWKLAADAARAGEPAALLIVTESTGSSPGRRGFKMAVTRDRIEGSIGGGVMEVGIVDSTLARLAEIEVPETVEFVHRQDSPYASGMICSGSQTVLVCPVRPADLAALSVIAGTLRNGGEIRFTVGDRGLSAGAPIYSETLGIRPTLFVIGGGHCALALSEIMSRLGFRIRLFDDRSDVNTLEKNRFADEKTVVGSYGDIAGFVPSGTDHYVVVMTIGYRFDEIVIRRLFEHDYAYFGVLGSRAKMSKLLRSLADDGFDRGKLARIRTPVGLPINSRTPEEIAVSIAAEIIAVRNGAKEPRSQFNLKPE